jgi:hypothetical protein
VLRHPNGYAPSFPRTACRAIVMSAARLRARAPRAARMEDVANAAVGGTTLRVRGRSDLKLLAVLRARWPSSLVFR